MDFVMVIMASGIVRGHVRTMATATTTTTGSRNLAASFSSAFGLG